MAIGMDELQMMAETIVDEAKSRPLADGRMLYNALIESHNPRRYEQDLWPSTDRDEGTSRPLRNAVFGACEPRQRPQFDRNHSQVPSISPICQSAFYSEFIDRTAWGWYSVGARRRLNGGVFICSFRVNNRFNVSSGYAAVLHLNRTHLPRITRPGCQSS